METDAPMAPPVVAVVVVHDPGPWFDEALASLADQDYPNLNTLFLLTSGTGDGDEDVAALITEWLPDAFVRVLGTNTGFGAAANEVLRFVEGDSGFFLFCHDDVALEPDAVRMLVEELYRSNAGIVGPKLVTWEDRAVLQHVGLGLDRFGEVDPITEPGEYDQEQHDGVRDVFVLPSACLLVRADLFRALGGFDPAISFYGDDVDLCWRTHLSGARVVVAPQARVRHREELEVRRPDLHHDLLRARHRMRSVATLTSGGRLPVRSLELALLTVAELVIGLFTGRFGEAWASARALVGLLPRTPTLIARRRTIGKLRRVADTEILDLQNRGSARLTSYRRARDTATYIGTETTVRRWRESTIGVTIAWVVVIVGIIVASRTLIDTAVPSIGELRPLPASPRHWLADFVSAWNPAGAGQSVANPTGWAVVSLGSVFWLFRMGLGLTVLVVGSVFVGVWGAWRLATLYPSNRARVSALLVYAAVPLVPGVISTGRLSALFAYAAIPWFVHLLRVAVGIGTADPAAAVDDLRDGVIALSWRERVRRTALLTVATAVAVALAPAILPIVLVVTLVLGLTSLVSGAGWRTAAWFSGLGLVACAGAWILNVPWSPTWSWSDLAATPIAGADGRGALHVATMAIGGGRFEVLAIALYLPLLVGLAVARAWRLTWAARAGGLVVVFLGLAVLQDRDDLPFAVPDVGLLLVPVALGLALAAASAVAAFGEDVAGRNFGWRQPAGLVSIAAVAIGVFPALLTLTDGAWYAPRTSLVEAVESALVPTADSGDYRVLYVGDPRIIPFPSDELEDGVAMALVDDGATDLRDRWPVAGQAADDALRDVVQDIAAGRTMRGGRLLAPFGIRYVIVPVLDGATSTAEDPLPIPDGLLAALGDQLDIVRSISPPDFARFENRAVIPTAAVLDATLAEASRNSDLDALVSVDTSTATPILTGVDRSRRATADAPAGSINMGTPLDGAWELTTGGAAVTGRASFGVATAYDLPAAGTVELAYRQPVSRTMLLVLQALLWVVVLVAASRLTVPARLRGRRGRDETLITLDAGPGIVLPGAPAGGDDRTGVGIVRPTTSPAGGDGTGSGGWVDELLADEEAEP
ncbi:MAG: glycosyltransferase [Ilumatobacteraceae bacterium]